MNRSLKYGAWAVALALAGPLRAADDAAPPPPPPDDVAALRADNKQLTDELAASWKENADLKASLTVAQAPAPKGADQASPAPADAGSAQLGDVQDKLATALRSYSLLQDEDAQLKASLDKANADNLSLTQQIEAAKASIAALQVQAAATSQIAPLQTEVRQAQDEASQLAAENASLQTRLELQAPAPGSKGSVPMRPAQAAALQPAPPPPAPAPPPAKTYVVAEGDTLTKISKKFYGTSGRWEDILNANHAVVKDEKSLVVGSTLTIP